MVRKPSFFAVAFLLVCQLATGQQRRVLTLGGNQASAARVGETIPLYTTGNFYYGTTGSKSEPDFVYASCGDGSGLNYAYSNVAGDITSAVTTPSNCAKNGTSADGAGSWKNGGPGEFPIAQTAFTTTGNLLTLTNSGVTFNGSNPVHVNDQLFCTQFTTATFANAPGVPLTVSTVNTNSLVVTGASGSNYSTTTDAGLCYDASSFGGWIVSEYFLRLLTNFGGARVEMPWCGGNGPESCANATAPSYSFTAWDAFLSGYTTNTNWTAAKRVSFDVSHQNATGTVNNETPIYAVTENTTWANGLSVLWNTATTFCWDNAIKDSNGNWELFVGTGANACYLTTGTAPTWTMTPGATTTDGTCTNCWKMSLGTGNPPPVHVVKCPGFPGESTIGGGSGTTVAGIYSIASSGATYTLLAQDFPVPSSFVYQQAVFALDNATLGRYGVSPWGPSLLDPIQFGDSLNGQGLPVCAAQLQAAGPTTGTGANWINYWSGVTKQNAANRAAQAVSLSLASWVAAVGPQSSSSTSDPTDPTGLSNALAAFSFSKNLSTGYAGATSANTSCTPGVTGCAGGDWTFNAANYCPTASQNCYLETLSSVGGCTTAGGSSGPLNTILNYVVANYAGITNFGSFANYTWVTDPYNVLYSTCGASYLTAIAQFQAGSLPIITVPARTSSTLTIGILTTGSTLYFGGIPTGSAAADDNYYCSAANTPQNGLNLTDYLGATGPQRCMNTAIINTPSPNGFYQHGGGNYTAQNASDLTNILAGTGGFAQIACGQTLQLKHGVTFTGNFVLPALSCTATTWITIESDAVANLPPEQTRITPCYEGLTSLTGYPAWTQHSGCSTDYVAHLKALQTSAGPALNTAAAANFYRIGPGVEATRDDTGFQFAIQATTATPNAFHRTCTLTGCTLQIGIGSAFSLDNYPGIVNGTTGDSQQSTFGGNAYGYNGNATPMTFVGSAGAYHDFTVPQTLASATMGNNGTFSTVSRDASCNVTGTYTFTGTLGVSSLTGVSVMPAQIADSSFNTGSSYSLTTATIGSGSIAIGYNQTGCGGASSGSSSGGELIITSDPTLVACSPSQPNNNCNGIAGQPADVNSLVNLGTAANNIIFDRFLFTGAPGSETDNGIQTGDTDHISVVDSFFRELHSIRITGLSDEGHAASGSINNNTDANAGVYKLVNNFMSASGEDFIFGGGAEGCKGSSIAGNGTTVTVTFGTLCSYLTSGAYFMATAGQFSAIEGNQTMTCSGATCTFPNTTVISSTACAPGCTVGGYIPSDFEIRRNWLFKLLTWNPLDASYNGGVGPSGALPFTVKNGSEFKNGRQILIEANVYTNIWNTVDQIGTVELFTPKNQGNNCPSCAVKNVIFRYNRASHANAAYGLSSSNSDAGSIAFENNHYSIHDNLFSDMGGSTLTCGWLYPPSPSACSAQSPVQTVSFRGGSINTPLAFVTHDVNYDHETFVSSNANFVHVFGGANTNPGAQFNMRLTNSIFENGPGNAGNAGGGATSCANQSSVPANRINNCWGTPNWDYNALYDNLTSGAGECNALAAGNWPGTHDFFFDSATASSTCSSFATGIKFVNYNGSLPIGNGSNFALAAGSPLIGAASDTGNIGANITTLENYTLNIDTLP